MMGIKCQKSERLPFFYFTQMLSSISRSITRVDKAVIKCIGNGKWLCTNKSGIDILLSTDHSKPAVRPGQAILMALGACSSADIRADLEKQGYKIKDISAEVIGKFDTKPARHMNEIDIKFTVDADGVSQEKVNQAAQIALTTVCPVANTLTGETTLKYKAIIKNN